MHIDRCFATVSAVLRRQADPARRAINHETLYLGHGACLPNVLIDVFKLAAIIGATHTWAPFLIVFFWGGAQRGGDAPPIPMPPGSREVFSAEGGETRYTPSLYSSDPSIDGVPTCPKGRPRRARSSAPMHREEKNRPAAAFLLHAAREATCRDKCIAPLYCRTRSLKTCPSPPLPSSAARHHRPRVRAQLLLRVADRERRGRHRHLHAAHVSL